MILQLNNEALAQKLKLKKLEPCYILGSHETILLQEARQLIWSIAQQAGFQTRHVVDLSVALDWDQLRYQYNTHDLFSERQFIELNCPQLPNESVGQELYDFMTAYQSNASFNRIMVLSFDQFKPNSAQPGWFKQMSQVNTVMFLLSPTQHTFPQWIKQRMHKYGLSLTQEAVIYLVKGTEGNLNAAIQSIEKLTLIYGRVNKQLSIEDLRGILEDEAQFAIFTLNESILQSDDVRTIRILSHFAISNIAPSLVLGCILRLLRCLAALYYRPAQQSLASLFKEHNIWPKHQAAFQRSISIVQQDDLYRLFNDAHQIDRYIKGLEKGSVWENLQKFCVQLSRYFR